MNSVPCAWLIRLRGSRRRWGVAPVFTNSASLQKVASLSLPVPSYFLWGFVERIRAALLIRASVRPSSKRRVGDDIYTMEIGTVGHPPRSRTPERIVHPFTSTSCLEPPQQRWSPYLKCLPPFCSRPSEANYGSSGKDKTTITSIAH